MSSPVLRGAAGFANATTSSTTLPVTFPVTLALGDLMVIYASEGGSTAVSWSCSAPVSGAAFTTVTELAGASNQGQLLYKTADAQDVTNAAASTAYTLTCSVAHFCVAAAFAYSSVSGFDPTPSTSGQANTSSTNIAAPGITTTLNGDILVWIGVTSIGAGGTPAAITPPSGFASEITQANNASGAGTNSGILMADFTQATAGATGTETGTQASGHTSIGVLLGIAGPTGTNANAGFAAATGASLGEDDSSARSSVILNMTIRGV